MLSLGPQHSFPLSDVFRYLHPETTRDVLVQAFLDAPVFKTRWRWNTTISLAVPRARGSRKVAPQIQRMLADDLMAAVFPDAAACLENIPGDRQIPDHPLVAQTVRDCLEEAMDFEGLRGGARAAFTAASCGWSPATRLSRRCSPTKSSTRSRTRSSTTRRSRSGGATRCRPGGRPTRRRPATSARSTPSAIARVRDEERPDPRDADELHDALLTAGFLTTDELDAVRAGAARRADDGAPRRHRRPRRTGGRRVAIVVCRRAAARAARDSSRPRSSPPSLQPPASRLARSWSARRRDRRAPARPAHADRSGHGGRAGGSARHAGRRRRRGAAAARSGGRGAARPLHARARPRSNGATGRCWPASTATRCTGCAPRSSRSARPSSCASCSAGSTSKRRRG